MRQKTHQTREKKNTNVIQININLSTVPSQTRKFSRLKNKAQVFEDRRFKKPKYKNNYMED